MTVKYICKDREFCQYKNNCIHSIIHKLNISCDKNKCPKQIGGTNIYIGGCIKIKEDR
jgi:hypothetical protein